MFDEKLTSLLSESGYSRQLQTPVRIDAVSSGRTTHRERERENTTRFCILGDKAILILSEDKSPLW